MTLSLFTVNGQGDQNILVNVFFSLGMGLALLVMGIDIDLNQVMEAVRQGDKKKVTKVTVTRPAQASDRSFCWILLAVSGNASSLLSPWIPSS